jgi:hypothetical protein
MDATIFARLARAWISTVYVDILVLSIRAGRRHYCSLNHAHLRCDESATPLLLDRPPLPFVCWTGFAVVKAPVSFKGASRVLTLSRFAEE